MNFPRAIALSLVFHSALLGVAHLGSRAAGPSTLDTRDTRDPVRQADVSELLKQFGDPEGRNSSGDASGATPSGGESRGAPAASEPSSSEDQKTPPSDERAQTTDASEDSSTATAKAPKETEPEPETTDPSDQSTNPSPTPDKRLRESSDTKPRKLAVETDDPSEQPPSSEQETSEPSKESASSASESPPESSNSAIAGQTTSGGEGTDGVSGSGTGGSGSSGTSTGAGGSAGTGASRGVDKDALRRGYNRSVYQFIQKHKEYPDLARRANLDGRVILDVIIARGGEILDVDVHQSSGHRLLDESAVETLRELGKLPAPPTQLKWEQKRLRIPMAYQLN